MPVWISSVIRSLVLLAAVILIFRILGRRISAGITAWEQTVIVVIGVTAALASFGVIRPWSAVAAGLVIWVTVPVVLHLLSMKFSGIRNILQGKDVVLMQHGKVLDDKLMQVRLTPEDFLALLRKKNVFCFADVEQALMEANGELSIYLKKQKGENPTAIRPVPTTVMLDGNILDEALGTIGLNRNWLLTELNKKGVAVENVFIAQIDANGQLYLDLFNDNIAPPQPKTVKLTLLSLKKAQADLEMFALETKDPRVKQIYGRCATELKQSMTELEPYLEGEGKKVV